MAYSIALNFEDGVTRFIESRPGETVADASYRVGINIPLDCRDGACGTCKCHVQSGSYDGGSYIEDALTDDEAAAGFALACQMKPSSDLVVDIAASSAMCKTRPRTHQGTLHDVQRLSPSSIAFSVAGLADLAFLPGQYVNVRVPGTDLTRSYSFSSTPGVSLVSFLVRDIPHGKMSSFLRDAAAPGVEMAFAGPAGSFYLRDIKRPVLFLAGGTGLAPFLSMLGRIAATGSSQPLHLIYGVTHDEDLVGLDQLEAFAERIPGFTFACCVANEASTYPTKGYVTRYIELAHVNAGDVDVYLCGPPAMVEAVRGWLAGQGIQPANFYYEKFSPSGAVTAIGEVHRQVA